MERIFFTDLSDEDRDAFARGFRDADDIGVDDWDCSTPWGCPWEWADAMWVTDPKAGPYEWGREWFEQCRPEILEASEEAED